jgi:hypothetical protein
LIFWKIDGDAKVFENLDSGFRHIVEERVTKAGAHEKHALVEGAGAGCGHGKKCLFTGYRSGGALQSIILAGFIFPLANAGVRMICMVRGGYFIGWGMGWTSMRRDA